MRWTSARYIAKVRVLAADAHGHPLYAPGEKAGIKMKNHPPFGVAIVLASLLLVSPGLAQEQAGTSPPTNLPSNDAIVHHYIFTLYALDVARLSVDGKFTGIDVRNAMRSHMLAAAKVSGRYTLNPSVRM